MKRILQLKPLEALLVIFIIPGLINYNSIYLSKICNNPMIYAGIITLLQLGLIELWFYSLGKYLKSDHINILEIKFFKYNLIAIFIFYCILVPLVLYSFFNSSEIARKTFHITAIVSQYVNIYIYISIFYTVITAAKIIVTNELNRQIKINDYYKVALMIIILPISIFWLQPQIQKILAIPKSNNKKRELVLIFSAIVLILVLINYFISNNNSSNNNINKNNYVNLIEKTELDSINVLLLKDTLNAKLYFNRSLTYYKHGQIRKSINDLNKAIKIDSLNSEYYYNRGVFLFQDFHQLDSAIKDMSASIKLNKNDWRAFQNRGYYRYLLKDYKLALPDINKAIILNPKFSGSYLIRGYLKELNNDMIGACQDWTLADSLGNKDAIIELKFKCKKTN